MNEETKYLMIKDENGPEEYKKKWVGVLYLG